MAQVNEVLVGVVPNLGLNMYRKFVTFIPKIYVEGDQVSLSSFIEVYYTEYVKDKNGTIYNESIKNKHYVVENVPAQYDEEGTLIHEAWPAFEIWFNALDRTPIDVTQNGILDAVEYTLTVLPINVSNGYKLRPH